MARSVTQLPVFLFAAAVQMIGAASNASPIYDTINGAATPAFELNSYVYFGRDGIGWYYTPETSYYLDEIQSQFSYVGGDLSGEPPQPVTVRIHTDSPDLGGILLAQAEFTVVRAQGGWRGGSFAPVLLDDGERYFVSFIGIENLGINLAGWTGTTSNPVLTGGADELLPYYFYTDDGVFDEPLTAGFSTVRVEATGTDVNVALRAPILRFHGYAVPEPSTLSLITVVFLAGTTIPRCLCRVGQNR